MHLLSVRVTSIGTLPWMHCKPTRLQERDRECIPFI